MSIISSFSLRRAPKSGKDATTLYIRGTGYDRMAPSLVQINGVDLLSNQSSRGLHVVTINRDTLTKVDERNFDTYGNKYEQLKTDYASISDIVSYLSSLDDSVFVCMCTYDAVYWPSSYSTMLECIGCTPIDISTERTPFACVGIKELAPGYAMQIQSSVGSSAPYAELSTYIANRMFVSSKTKDDPLTIQTDSPSIIVTANSSGVATGISGLSTIKGRFGKIIVSFQMFDTTATKFHFDGSSNYASLSDMDNGFTLTSGNLKVFVSENGDGLSIGVSPESETAQCSPGMLIADLVIKYHNVTYTRTISIPIIINRKGDKGDKGDTGISGCLVRTTEWELGKEYRNDTDITDPSAVKYLDYVTATSSTSYTAYLCKKTHTSSSAIGVNNTTYWTAANIMAPISTPFISVQQALAKYIQANQLVVTDNNNVVTSGLSGIYNNDDDDVSFWSGGTFEQAIAAVQMFKNDPTHQPSEAELTSIAKAVITHGGKIFMNDAVLRGYVYALGGIFKNIKLSGSIRNPFENSTGTFNIDTNDNVIVLGNGNEDIDGKYTLPWTIDNNGRKIIIANYKYNGNSSTGFITIYAPEGKYIFDNGGAQQSLGIPKNGIVELLGIGDSTNLYGWFVLHKKNFNDTGIPMSALAYGQVFTSQGTDSIVSSLIYKTSSEGVQMDVERLSTGSYKITHPDNYLNNCIVMLTGVKGMFQGSGVVNACVIDQNFNYFLVETHDDSSLNDGSFNFIIYNLMSTFNRV